MAKKIAIVNSSTFGIYFTTYIDKLRSIADINRLTVDKNIDGKTLAKLVSNSQVIVASVTPKYNNEFFQCNKDVILICRHGIGYDNIDINSATENGVIVTKVSGSIERETMAEYTVGLLLQVCRKICQAYNATKQGKWSDRMKFVGIELSGKKAGIIGFGNIGSRVVQILKLGFNMDILVYDPYVNKNAITELGVKAVNLECLLKESDIISLHANLNKDNYHLLSKEQFKLMKNGVIIINTARGELIDESCLIENIETGKVAGVGLDVIEGEPINSTHPLLKYNNVVITPHIGAFTLESLEGMDRKIVQDIEKVLIEKQIPDEIVNPEVIKKSNRAGLQVIQ